MAQLESPAITLLTTLFEPSDLILFRPVEAWTEAGRKHSRVDYSNVCYRPAKATTLEQTLTRLETSSESERTNLFFGVCPRVGNKGRFDLAWQIRVVRCLWADIDGCNVAQAIERCNSQAIPAPTAIVNSGNGVHLYWRLDRPLLIDDVGDPPPVETEWSIGSDGRKKPRRFILDGKDRVFLDRRHHLTKTSPKALQAQDLLMGIAAAINADHTTDLTRLLRLPGTLNRKDQRNGREPIKAELIECDSNRRYTLDAFKNFAKSCEATKRQQQIEAMPLPAVRKLSAGKSDKLSELVAACTIAPDGTRSEADFAVCCYAIRNGVAKDEVWNRLQSVGKFAEQGRRYFDLTWESGEYDVRATLCDRLQKRVPNEIPAVTAPSGDQQVEESDERRTITIDSRSTPVASTMDQITDRLLATGSCFNRVEQLVVVREQSISPVLSSAELTGLLNQHVEFYFVNEDGGEYKPLPTSYANTWLNNVGQRERLPAIRLFSHNPIYTEDWRMVSPGFDPSPVSSTLVLTSSLLKGRSISTRCCVTSVGGSRQTAPITSESCLRVCSSHVSSAPSRLHCSTGISLSLANRFLHKSWQSFGMAIMWKPRRTTRTTRNSRSGWEQSSGVALRQSLSITPRPEAAIPRSIRPASSDRLPILSCHFGCWASRKRSEPRILICFALPPIHPM